MSSDNLVKREPNSSLWISRRFILFFVDVLVLLILGALLYYGASWQIFEPYTDAARYQCYTVAFWKGIAALRGPLQSQCSFLIHPDQHLLLFSHDSIIHTMKGFGFPGWLVQFVDAQSSSQPFHALPYEYPLLTLIPFTLALAGHTHWFQVAFAMVMILVAMGIYVILLCFRSRKAALAYALYIVVGGWATVAGRFDIVPAALTLTAVIFGVRLRWNWAYAFLALATLYKFYPVVLLPSFLLAQQLQLKISWLSWKRWISLGVFVAVCAVMMLISLSLSVEGTLAPFSYFSYRPVQVESLASTLLWLLSLVGLGTPKYVFTYGSLNILSSFSSLVSTLTTVGVVVGSLYLYWLQLRGKVDLPKSCLLTLLIIMVTGKVFSPQYLMWVIPLAAYIGEWNGLWLVIATIICALTTWIYPYIYLMTRDLLAVPRIWLFMPVTLIRNVLLLVSVICLLYFYSRQQQQVVSSDIGSSIYDPSRLTASQNKHS